MDNRPDELERNAEAFGIQRITNPSRGVYGSIVQTLIEANALRVPKRPDQDALHEESDEGWSYRFACRVKFASK